VRLRALNPASRTLFSVIRTLRPGGADLLKSESVQSRKLHCADQEQHGEGHHDTKYAFKVIKLPGLVDLCHALNPRKNAFHVIKFEYLY
jgi:hypothetical protein